jgi:hypothetical protein
MAWIRRSRRIVRPCGAVLLVASLAACGGGRTATSAQPATPPATSASLTPTPPSVAADAATATAALVTAAELGTPWVHPKQVSRVKVGKDELCPGHPSDIALAKPRAVARTALTEGTKRGATIASFVVRVLEPGQSDAWRAAVLTAERGCLLWKAAEGNYVTLTVLDPRVSVPAADDVVGHIERVYAEATHRTLLYVRQVLEVRSGRVVTTLELAFVTSAADPTGKDFTKTARLLTKQAAKAQSAFRS